MRMVSDMSSLKAKVFGFDMICGTYSLKFVICLFLYISTSDMRKYDVRCVHPSNKIVAEEGWVETSCWTGAKIAATWIDWNFCDYLLYNVERREVFESVMENLKNSIIVQVPLSGPAG